MSDDLESLNGPSTALTWTGSSWGVCTVRVDALVSGPWTRRVTSEHAAQLAVVRSGWQPILVTATGVVIDGWARVQACRLLGSGTVGAVVFTGTDAQAWEAAAAANRTTQQWSKAQRRLAVEALLSEGPARSSRDLARALNVSPSFVERVRNEGAADGSRQNPSSRIGSDGRARAVDCAQVRAAIRALIEMDPTRSDRSIAKSVGCSPTTVGSVRRSRANRRGWAHGLLRWVRLAAEWIRSRSDG